MSAGFTASDPTREPGPCLACGGTREFWISYLANWVRCDCDPEADEPEQEEGDEQ